MSRKHAINRIPAADSYRNSCFNPDSDKPDTECWRAMIQTAQPLASFPQLQLIMAERQTTPAYRHEGRFRSSDLHCIFKYTLSGEGRFRMGRKTYRLPAGCGFLCEIRDPSTAYWFPPAAREPWEFVYLAFTGSAATDMTREFIRAHGPVFCLPPDAGFIPKILDWQNRDRQEILVTAAEGARVVADLFEALAKSKFGTTPSDAGLALVKEMRRLVEGRLRQFCNVKTIAAELGVTREHLGRVFKEQTGQSPYRYLQRRKMIEACRLLKETHLTQKEIAERMGFAVPAHFARTFSRVMRLTPLRFRAVGTMPIP